MTETDLDDTNVSALLELPPLAGWPDWKTRLHNLLLLTRDEAVRVPKRDYAHHAFCCFDDTDIETFIQEVKDCIARREATDAQT